MLYGELITFAQGTKQHSSKLLLSFSEKCRCLPTYTIVTFKNDFVTEKSVLIFVTSLVSSLSVIFV